MERLKVDDQLPQQPRRNDCEITVMPDKETLEDFLRGSSSHPTVIFDIEKGVFIRTRPHIENRQNPQYSQIPLLQSEAK